MSLGSNLEYENALKLIEKPFQCVKVPRDTKIYNDAQLKAYECSDAVACYEQQQQYNSAVVEYNNKMEANYKKERDTVAAHNKTIDEWDVKAKALRTYYNDNWRHYDGASCGIYAFSDISGRCSQRIGSGWTSRETDKWVKCGSLGGGRLKCFRTANQIDIDINGDLGPRPMVHEQPQAPAKRAQNETASQIACCSNYVNTGNGNITDFRQECNLKLKDIEETVPTNTTQPATNTENIDSDIDEENAKKKKKIISFAILITIGILVIILIIFLATR